jgi:hypothetical protein
LTVRAFAHIRLCSVLGKGLRPGTNSAGLVACGCLHYVRLVFGLLGWRRICFLYCRNWSGDTCRAGLLTAAFTMNLGFSFIYRLAGKVADAVHGVGCINRYEIRRGTRGLSQLVDPLLAITKALSNFPWLAELCTKH